MNLQTYMIMVGNGADILSSPKSGSDVSYVWCEVPNILNRKKHSQAAIVSHEIQKKTSSDLKYRWSPKTNESGEGFIPRQIFPSPSSLKRRK